MDTQEVTVRTPEDPQSLAFQVMDVADEEQLMADFKGLSNEIVGKWVYEFPQDGTTVRGLSWVGTKELLVWLSSQKKKVRMVISEMPEYTKLEDKSIDGQNYIDATVVFKDLNSGRTMSAIVRQSYNRKGKGGSIAGKIDVEFVPRMAISKAQRNAIQKLIPAQTLANFISYAIKNNQVQRLIPDKAQMKLTEGEIQPIANHLSNIEQLQTVQEVNAYLSVVNKMVGQEGITGKMIYELKKALSIKITVIKQELAKKKVKEMTQ